MWKNTPSLDSYEKKEIYVKDHLFNELRWMLAAATEWSVQNQLNLGIAGYDVIVYAMDSVFVHARALFEFFVKETNANHYGCDEFLGAGNVLLSGKYQKWSDPLHRHLMHAQTRSEPEQLHSFSGQMKDLNKMPVEFANEILTLWKELEEKLRSSSDTDSQKLGALARDKREEAIKGATCVVNSSVAQQHATSQGRTLQPIFHFA